MVSSLNLEFPAQRLGLRPSSGTLVFGSNEVAFYPTSSKHPEVYIASNKITDFAVDTVDTRKSELTLPRLLLLDIWAFAFPKTTGSLSIAITIQTADQQVSFLINEETIEAIRPKVQYYLDQWRITPR